jgi:hypothetical protein
MKTWTKRHVVAGLDRDQGCLGRAGWDEPVFILRAKDPAAAHAIRAWAVLARGIHEDDKVTEAQQVAVAFDEWRADYLQKEELKKRVPRFPDTRANVNLDPYKGRRFT